MSEDWPDRFWDWATTTGIRIVAVILGAIVFYLILRTITRRLLHVARRMGEKSDYVSREQEMRARTLAGIMRGLTVTVLVVVVALMILHELGYDVAPLLAGAGIAGIALGLGAQTLVRDVIGGFFVLLEGQFYVGDVVRVGDVKGRVEAIKLRTTLVRDSEGVLHIIPNGEMRIVSNLTKGWSRVVLDFDVDYMEDVGRIFEYMEAALVEAKKTPEAKYIIDGPSVLGVENVHGRTMTIRVVAQTKPFHDNEVARALRKEIASVLGAHKVGAGV